MGNLLNSVALSRLLGAAAFCAGLLYASQASAQVSEIEAAPLQGEAWEDEVSLAEDLPLESASPAEGSTGRVFLASAVGQVTVDRANAVGDKRTYAVRSEVAGSAALISFSSQRPSAQGAELRSISLRVPVSYSAVTGRFGERRQLEHGGSRAHAGVDLAAPQGTPVSAALSGRVSLANWSGSYGLLVVLDHGNGLQTRYAHLSRLGVTAGQHVGQGDVIGLVGSTGRSTGPHLHYELRQFGRAVDPFPR